MLPVLVDKILASSEYAELVGSLGRDAELASAAILEGLHRQVSRAESTRQDQIFSANSQDSKISWSLGSLASGCCPSIEDLQSISKRINPDNQLEERVTAVEVDLFNAAFAILLYGRFGCR
jgi:hypothetical protein